MTIYDDLRAARRVSTPIVTVDTVDPSATLAELVSRANGSGPPAIVQWDCAAGLRALTEPGREALTAMLSEDNGADLTIGNPVKLLADVAPNLPDGGILAVHAAGRWLSDPMAAQAARNLREPFKATRRTLLLLGQDMDLPAELAGDVLGFTDPLPDAERLGGIVRGVFADAALAAPADDVAGPIVDAVRGLSAFVAEQSVALCLGPDGVNLPGLWDRKLRIIDATPALSVFRDVEGFSDVRGLENVTAFLKLLMGGRRRPRCVIVLDEIDKSIGGSQGDTSGVSQDQSALLLQYQQETGCAGLLAVGPPGVGKSMVGKAAGALGGVPTLALDLGAAKGSLVGQSEAQIRAALRVVSAISDGSPLFIGTCNRVVELPPEIRSRFGLGTWYFDLPTPVELDAIWTVHLGRFGLPLDSPRPADSGWTGREVRACCDVADRLGISPADAAGYIVPVARSSADSIDQLRAMAEARAFISASVPGPYRRPSKGLAAGGRRLDIAG